MKNLAFAAPLRAALVAGSLKRLLAVAVGGGAEPRLKALAEATLVALGLEGGESAARAESGRGAVYYKHLTLATILRVLMSVVAG